ncbi:MAG: elongation factor G [Pirellulales bacterium]
MAKVHVESIRNIVLCGHGLAGKTTLIDKMLMKTGAINRPASVDDGTSVCDFDEEEKHHKHSIESSIVHFEHAGKHFNLIDTPGYPDFIGQTIGAMRAVETACIVIDAHHGIAVNTRRVFHEAGKAGLGRILVINKMDTDNIDFPKLLDSIREMFGKSCVLWDVPLGVGHDFRGVANVLEPPADTQGALVDPAQVADQLIEAIVEVDEHATEQYFEGIRPSDEELPELVDKALIEGTLIPILCVSAKTGVGMTELLDALALSALPPTVVPRLGTKDGADVVIKADESAPLVAQVFKTRIDPFVQRLSYLRIYSGRINKDDNVHVSGSKKAVKLHQLLEVQGGETHAIDGAGPGSIIAVAKVEDLHTGSCLGDVTLPRIEFPTPMVGLAAEPKTRGDEGKLSTALHKIVEEDQTFRLDRDPQTKELVITGTSELHLQLILERLKRRDKVEMITHAPKVPYRETIQANADGSYRHKKQSGGRGQFGEVHIRLYPLPIGAKPEEFATKERFPSMREFKYDPQHNFIWVDSIVGGTIPNNFLPAVEKGFKERMDRGVIAGYKVQNVCAEVYFGKHHPVDSSEAAFKTAGSMAFRNVFQQARPSLLEPIVTLHITVPSGKVGDINADMSGRRGRVLGMDSAGGDLQTVEAEAPLSEVMTYARSLSSITGGQGSYSMEFNRYDVVPGNVQKEIIDKAKLEEEEEE